MAPAFVFRAPSEPGTILQENDIFFVDIGPVWQKWEGDAGNTHVEIQIRHPERQIGAFYEDLLLDQVTVP